MLFVLRTGLEDGRHRASGAPAMLGSKRATTCCDPQYAAAQHGSTAEFLAVSGVIPIPPAFGTSHVPARRPADPLVRDHRRIDLPAAPAAARGQIGRAHV